MRIVGILLVLIMATAAAFASPTPALSPAQRARLDRGEIVLLDVLPPGGDTARSQGGTVLTVVHAAPDAVWRVLVDYPRHRGLYPRVVDAQVLEAAAGHALVRYTVGVGPFSFGFHVDNWEDGAQRRLTWRLASGRRNDLFRESWGYWAVEPDARGAVLVYAMAARTVLPPFLTRGAERDGLVDTVRAVRERVEQEVE